VGQCSADLAGSDQCNLVSRHRRKALAWQDIPRRMIFSEKRSPPRIASGAAFSGSCVTPRQRRSLTRPAGAFKPPTASTVAAGGRCSRPLDFHRFGGF
jgi:hypothetical protein